MKPSCALEIPHIPTSGIKPGRLRRLWKYKGEYHGLSVDSKPLLITLTRPEAVKGMSYGQVFLGGVLTGAAQVSVDLPVPRSGPQ